jgi:hypothetical protein
VAVDLGGFELGVLLMSRLIVFDDAIKGQNAAAIVGPPRSPLHILRCFLNVRELWSSDYDGDVLLKGTSPGVDKRRGKGVYICICVKEKRWQVL